MNGCSGWHGLTPLLLMKKSTKDENKGTHS